MPSPYKPKYFETRELFPPNVIAQFKSDRIWQLMDGRILITADRIREHYGKMIANTYPWGGRHKERGFRHWSTLTGAQYSDHKFGRAIDLVPADLTTDELRAEIIKSKGKASTKKLRHIFKYVTALEVDIPWVHIACRNVMGLQIIHPK